MATRTVPIFRGQTFLDLPRLPYKPRSPALRFPILLFEGQNCWGPGPRPASWEIRAGLLATASCSQINHSVCPILLALGRGRRGRYHCAACRRGNRSRAAPGSPASSRVAQETNVQCSRLLITESPGAGPQSRTDDPLELGGWTRAHPPAVRLDLPAAHARRPQRAPPGPQSGESATRSRSSTLGAGRGQRVRGGASGAGRCRAEPSQAEPRGAGERQAEPAGGSAPIVLRFPARCLLAFAQAPAKLLLSRAPPGCVTKSQRSAVATLAGTGDRGDVQPSSAAGLLRPALPHLPIAPGNREGGPPKGPRGRRLPEILFTVADRLGATLT